MSHHPWGRVPPCTGGYTEEGRDAPTTMCWEQNLDLDLSPAPSSPAGRIWALGVSGGNCLFIAKLHSFSSWFWAIAPVSEDQRGEVPCLGSDGYGVGVLVQTHGCLSCQQHFFLWGDFSPRGHCSAWRHSVVITGVEGASGLWHVAVRDAAKPPAMHRTAPTTENCVVPNVTGAEAEKPCTRPLPS